MLKWINAGDFDRIEGVIAMGKESTVLHAVCDHNNVNTCDLNAGIFE